jgi:SH3-like domain-containing protein
MSEVRSVRYDICAECGQHANEHGAIPHQFVPPPRVVHLKREPCDVRIDRQTHWGNPFVIGKDGTRAQVIEKYRAWITAPEQAHMVELAKRDLRGKTLGCWCAPLEIANEATT